MENRGCTKPMKSCRLCLQHNINVSCLRHKCPFEACPCTKCGIIRLQRKVMSQQIRQRRLDLKLYRIQKEMNLAMGVSDPMDKIPSNYLCSHCKNHGVWVSKKFHSYCPYANCLCERCVLIQARSVVDLEMKKNCLLNPRSDSRTSKENKNLKMSNEMFDLMQEIFQKKFQINKATEPHFNASNLTQQPSFIPSSSYESPKIGQTFRLVCCPPKIEYSPPSIAYLSQNSIPYGQSNNWINFPTLHPHFAQNNSPNFCNQNNTFYLQSSNNYPNQQPLLIDYKKDLTNY